MSRRKASKLCIHVSDGDPSTAVITLDGVKLSGVTALSFNMSPGALCEVSMMLYADISVTAELVERRFDARRRRVRLTA